MAVVFGENIDFSEYLQETDAAHSVRKPSSYVEDVIAYFQQPDEAKGAKLPWEKTNGEVRIRGGEVSLWNGINGHGKSLALGQVCMALMGQNQPVCIASFEMKPAKTLQRMCRQAAAHDLPDVEFIRSFHTNTDNKLWLYDQQGTVRSDKILAMVRYCADRLSVKHIVIDSLMKCGIREDDYNTQKGFIDQLTACARDHNIHIHLVTHARKGENEMAPPNKMDVKGSGSITDQVDNVFTVWRNKGKERSIQENGAHNVSDPDALLICDKQRNGEWEGKIALWFDPRSQQFLGNSYSSAQRLRF